MSFSEAASINNFKCSIDKNYHLEVSLVENNLSSVNLFYNKHSFAQCLYNTTSDTFGINPKAQVQQGVWTLALKNCEYYSKKHSQISPLDSATFKQGVRSGYFRILKDKQPLYCLPKS